MNVIVEGHHVSVTPAMKAHAEKKVGRLTKYFEAVPTVEILCRVERHTTKDKQQQAQVTVKASGVEHHAEAESHCLYKALGKAVDKVCGQVVRSIETRKKPGRGQSLGRAVANNLLHSH